MLVNQDYQIYNLQEFIGLYAAATQTPMAFVRVTGWHNSSDVDKINEAITTYGSLLENDMMNEFRDSEYNFITLEQLDEHVLMYFEDNFPSSQTAVTNSEMYIFYALYNDQGQLIASNE